MKVEFGTYVGDGTDDRTVSLSDAGLTPDFGLIKADAGNFATLRLSAGYAANESERLTDATEGTGWLNSFALGGFVVDNAPQSNSNGVTYYYGVIEDDGNGDFVIGTYTGDGNATQQISGIGFAPECVWVSETDTADEWWHSLAHGGATDKSSPFDGAAESANQITDITAPANDGFTVHQNINVNGVTYRYVCWKPVAGKIDSVSYVGDGNDDRQIATSGQPAYAQTHGASGRTARWRTDGHVGDDSSFFTDQADAADAIQGLAANHVEIGTSVNVNANGETYYLFWFADNPVAGGVTAPTSHLYGSLVGPLGGPV